MNILSTITEIGILETMRVVSQNHDCHSKVSFYLPLVRNDEIENHIQFLSGVIVGTLKESVFLLSPEIALLEGLAAAHWDGTALLAIPSDLDIDSKERIYANTPDGVKTIFIDEGDYPIAFRPDNGIIICTGIVTDGYRQYILPSSCRMMSLYKVFQGDRLLFSCFPGKVNVPDIGWSYTEHDFFTHVIEEEEAYENSEA